MMDRIQEEQEQTPGPLVAHHASFWAIPKRVGWALSPSGWKDLYHVSVVIAKAKTVEIKTRFCRATGRH